MNWRILMKKTSTRKVIAVSCVLIGAGLFIYARGLTARTCYTIVSIPGPGGADSRASAINNAGQVIGEFVDSDGNERPFFWQDGVMTDMGELGLAEAYVMDVNNKGQVVGGAKTADGSAVAFLWDSSKGVTEIEFAAGETFYLGAINDAGQVVGIVVRRELVEITPGQTEDRMVLWHNGVVTECGVSGDVAEIIDINNTGQVVGLFGIRSDRGFVWDSAGGIKHLGTVGGRVSDASAINDDAQVVGYSGTAKGHRRACLWDANGAITDLGSVGWGPGIECMAFGLNNHGQVVGWCGRKHQAFFGRGRGFLWDKSTGMVDINKLLPRGSEWKRLIVGEDINDRGEIVGYGETRDGQTRGFVMIPADPKQ